MILKGQIQTNESDVLYPYTSTDIVYDENNIPLDKRLMELQKSIPTTLPANGGNSDTVDGKHADDFILKTQIKNNLEETATGNVLDSSQGKVLNDKIDLLEDKLQNHYNLGFKTATNQEELDNILNVLPSKNLDYSYSFIVSIRFNGSNITNIVDSSGGGQIFVNGTISKNLNYGFQKIEGYPMNRYILHRNLLDSQWEDWDIILNKNQIDTLLTSKIDVSRGVCTNLRLGNTIITNTNYNPTNGFLIKTGLYRYDNTMTSLRLTGCAYNNIDILDTRIEVYCFAETSYPVNIVVYCSSKVIYPKLFYINNELYIFIEKWSLYPTLKAEITTSHYTGDFYPEILNSPMPEYDENSLVEPEPIVSAIINKTDVNMTLKAGYMITEGSSCTKIGNIGYFIDIGIKKIDETIFTNNLRINVLSLPFSKINIPLICNSYSLSGTQSSGNATAMIRGKDLFVTPLTDTHIIEVSGFIPI